MKIYDVYEDLVGITSSFAKEVFIDYYDRIIGNKQATYMAELFLSEKAISDLIASGAIFKIVIENNTIVGFCEYIKEEEKIFLSKLYVHKDHRHKGIGRMMFDECLKYARNNDIHTIYLTVNKNNTSSYKIYEHLGFRNVRSVVNDIGNGYVMDDYIMELTI